MNTEQVNSDLSEQNSGVSKSNIIEEMQELNRQLQRSSKDVFKISSSWDKHPQEQSNKNSDIMMQDIMNYLIKINSTMTNNDLVINKLENFITESQAAIDKIEKTLIDTQTDLEETKTLICELHTDLDSMDTELSKMDTDLTKMDTDLTKIDTEMTKMNNSIERIQSGIFNYGIVRRNNVNNRQRF